MVQAYGEPLDWPRLIELKQLAKDLNICSSNDLLLAGRRLGRLPHLGEFVGNKGPDQTDTVLD